MESWIPVASHREIDNAEKNFKVVRKSRTEQHQEYDGDRVVSMFLIPGLCYSRENSKRAASWNPSR